MNRKRNRATFQTSSCWDRKIIVEKSVFALIVLITLQRNCVSGAPSEPLATDPNNSNSQSAVCETKSCVEAAANIIDFLDESLDPCDNFYKFACGNFLKKTQIPPEKSQVDTFSVISDLITDQLNTILNEPSHPNESKAVNLAKKYYQSCMNQSIREERGVKPLKDILEAFGGWPVTKGDAWSEESFNWIEILKKFRIRGFGTHYIFNFDVRLDYINSTRYILKLTSASIALSRKYLIKGFEDKHVNLFHKLLVEIAVLFGADEDRAKRELKESLEFEIKLANISSSYEETVFNRTTIKNLQESFPYLNWLDYMNAMMPQGLTIDENEVIIIQDTKYFEQLSDILNSTSKRTIANYIFGRVIYSKTSYLTNQIREMVFQFLKDDHGIIKQRERWKQCVARTNEWLPIAIGVMYVRKHLSERSKKAAVEMFDSIRNEFINILHNASWMDDETRVQAIEKVQLMEIHIGYPDELLDNNEVDKYYDNLRMEPDDMLLNRLRVEVFNIDLQFNKLRHPVNKTDWRTHTVATTVNAFYNPTLNSVLFPAAVLQGRLFSADRPQYMNYATIGQAVGHETTHGFDQIGSQIGADGQSKDWWNSNTKKKFLERAQCIIEQYGNYTDLKTNLTLDGIYTQNENIADNGGVKEAYNAYNNWVKRNGPEDTLPGLNYNQQQLFWINVAQVWCSVYTPQFHKRIVTSESYSPNEFRVNGVVSNLYSFASDFKCPEGSKMNPKQKCEVW